MILGGDDWVDTTLIERISPLLAKAPDVVHWRLRHVDEDGIELPPFNTGWSTDWPEDGWGTLRALVDETHQWLVLGGSSAWRRDLINDHSIRFTEGCATAEDKEFAWKALIHANTVLHLNETLGWYLLRRGSVTHAADIRRIDGCLAHQRVARQLRESGHPDGERLAKKLSDESVNRYFWVISDAVSLGNAHRLLKEIDDRAPGTTATIRATLRSKEKAGETLSWSERAVVHSPPLVPYVCLLRNRWAKARRFLGRRTRG